MKKRMHHKLVRDKIPDIIAASGKTCETRILLEAEYLQMVDAKLEEELKEYYLEQNLEELADLLEVLYAATIAKGYTLEELEQCRKEKRQRRGGFDRRVFLISTED